MSSSYLSSYEVDDGTNVEVHVNESIYRGEMTMKLANPPLKNPSLDIIVLDKPVELPIGKRYDESVELPVKDIRHIEVIEIGLFKKKSATEENDLPSLPSSVSNKPQKKSKTKVTGDLKDLAPVEIQLKTYVIKNVMQLRVLVKLIREIDVCGLLFEGHCVGRNGIVTWIVMTAGKTLIPFDIDTLYEQVPNLWKMLEKYILSNPKLIKVMHDGRAAADYLWHIHKIKMINIFDTQVADAFIAKEQMGFPPPHLNPLSDCLQMYNKRIPIEELEFLRKYEPLDFTSDSPYLLKPLPPPEYLKLCAIKVKHLIPLRENMISRLMEKYNMCVDAHLRSYKDQQPGISPTHPKPREVPQGLLDILEEDLGQMVV